VCFFAQWVVIKGVGLNKQSLIIIRNLTIFYIFRLWSLVFWVCSWSVNVYYKPIWCSQVTEHVKIANIIAMYTWKSVHPSSGSSSSSRQYVSPIITQIRHHLHHPLQSHHSHPVNQSMEVQCTRIWVRWSADHNKNFVAQLSSWHNNACVTWWKVDIKKNFIAQWTNPCSSKKLLLCHNDRLRSID